MEDYNEQLEVKDKYKDEEIQNSEPEFEILPDKDQKKIFIFLFFAVLILLFLFKDIIIFNNKYSSPVPTQYSSTPIYPSGPVLKDINTEATKKMRLTDYAGFLARGVFDDMSEDVAYIETKNPKELIRIKPLENNLDVKLLPMAYYSTSGRTVATNHVFSFSRWIFDDIVPFDIGLVWGDLASVDVLNKYFKFKSEKVFMSGARQLSYEVKNGAPLSGDYISSHRSHIHIIPANKNIFSALLTLKTNDLVKLDGYLVDIFVKDSHIKGSLSDSDGNGSSRSGGACKVMYLTKLQIGRLIYK